MDNKQFRKAMYNKYEYIKKNNNDDFFNTYHYKKHNRNNTINKVAAFFICAIMMGSVVYAGTVAYQFFTQKNSQANYIEDMDSWFEINQKGTYYKKISTYEEYLKYKENWDSIITMSQEGFENNFLIIIIDSWKMPGITISNISADDNTMYVELDSNVTEEEIKEEKYMVSAMVSKELDRENISVKNIVKKVESDKYEKIEDLPLDYNREIAEQDGCIIIDKLEIKEEDKEKLNNFIKNTKNGDNDYIRIFRIDEIKEEEFKRK